MGKYKMTMLIIFILSLFIMVRVDGYLNEMPLLGKLIYIDPGHGGIDVGANYKDIYEKDINLEISLLLANQLEEKGAIVYLTRIKDYDLGTPHAYLRKRSDLSKRVKLINDSNCDLYLSIHLNASQSTSWRGAQVFYNNINKKNKKLAIIFQDVLKNNLGSKRKIKEINDLYMYKRITRPGLLLELGFISNANERYILRQKYYQKKIVKALIEATEVYFKDNNNL